MTTLAELKPLIPILKWVSENAANNVCNDFYIRNSPQAQAIWRKINEWSDPNDKDEWTMIDLGAKDKILFFDFVALDYLIHLIEDAQS